MHEALRPRVRVHSLGGTVLPLRRLVEIGCGACQASDTCDGVDEVLAFLALHPYRCRLLPEQAGPERS